MGLAPDRRTSPVPPRSDGAVGFQAVVPTTLSGNLSVCATALNVGAGTGDTAIGCRSVANVDHNPMAASTR